MSSVSHDEAQGLNQVRRVPITRPFIWLNRGIGDLVTHRMASLAYGLLVSVMGGLVVMYERHPYFIAAAITGFLLVGPVLTAGLCELSRRHDRGEEVTFDTSLKVLHSHRRDLLRFAQILIVCSLVWFLLSTMLMKVFLDSAAPELSATVLGDVMSSITTEQLVAYILVGGGLAGVVFALSVVSIPMIIDRGAEASSAMRTSLRVTLADWPAMIVWAGLIAILVGIGFMTFLVGMVIIYPLLGHATWYAYKDLVK